jgi:hypothetical protein
MEYIRRFSSFLSKLNCNNTDCITNKNGFKKCNDDSIQEQNEIDLNKSVHIENNITNEQEISEPSEPFEPFELIEPTETTELNDPTIVIVDDFDEYHNHEIVDSVDSDYEFSNVVIQPVD